MEATASTHLVLDDATRRERAKARFYVLCQVLGWGFFWTLQTVYSLVFAKGDDARDPVGTVSIVTMVVAEGLLITHYSRRFIARWGWKQLGWRALGPRVLGFSAVQALVWSVVGYGYTILLYKLTGCPWPSKYGPALLIFVSLVNGTSLLGGWHCIYFFYHLFDRFNRSEVERAQLIATAKDSELRALKSQVNPHFIFNALNSLRALIDEDPARARLAVTQLSNLLRYSLQSAQAETVAFEDELRVVNDYLALEQVRHEERLRVRLDIEPDTLGLAVPPLLLQTLVENAVKYGISARPEGGEIVVEARCREGQLHLRVTNPGVLAPSGAAQKAGSTGLGLKNAAERLRIFFGDRAKLQLRAESASLVVAEVSLPVQMTRA